MGHIRIEAVTKTYGEFTALRGFDLDVEEGEFVSLLGPSGCGKTTLLRSIAGLETIQGGAIHIGDRLVSKEGYTMAPEQRNLGLIFQSYALWPHMRVFGNVAYSLKIRGWKREAIRERVHEVLDLVGLQGLHDRYPSELSGGQMQRVAVARSLAPEPLVLLFDEPLSNLDSKLREKMRFELRQIQQRVGTTAVYVTHDQSEAMVISDRIVLMNEGDIVQIGSAKELYEQPRSRFAAEFLGITNFVPARLAGAPNAAGEAMFALPGEIDIRGVMPSHVEGRREVTLAIRPENVAIRPVATEDAEPLLEGAQGFRGRVEDVVYMGNVGDVFVRVGEVRLRAQLLASHLDGLGKGIDVQVHIEPKHVHALPDDPYSTEDGSEVEKSSTASLIA